MICTSNRLVRHADRLSQGNLTRTAFATHGNKHNLSPTASRNGHWYICKFSASLVVVYALALNINAHVNVWLGVFTDDNRHVCALGLGTKDTTTALTRTRRGHLHMRMRTLMGCCVRTSGHACKGAHA